MRALTCDSDEYDYGQAVNCVCVSILQLWNRNNSTYMLQSGIKVIFEAPGE